jgi:hypothetical protein
MFPKQPDWLVLEKVLPSLLFEPFHDFGDVLGAVARADEQGVGRFHDDEIAHANRRYEFRRAPQKIAFRI